MVEKDLPCGHTTSAPCAEPRDTIRCMEPCEKRYGEERRRREGGEGGEGEGGKRSERGRERERERERERVRAASPSAALRAHHAQSLTPHVEYVDPCKKRHGGERGGGVREERGERRGNESEGDLSRGHSARTTQRKGSYQMYGVREGRTRASGSE